MKAILFDMDGVLIDSEVFYMENNMIWMQELGFTGSFDDILSAIGTTMQKTGEIYAAFFHGKYSVDDILKANDDYYARVKPNYSTMLRIGIKECVQELKKQGFKLAVCSSSSHDIITDVLKSTGLIDYFDYYVSGEQFKKSKPNPEIYEHASQLLGVPIESCVVVEDSPIGIEAGKRAGMTVIAMSHPLIPLDQSNADKIVENGISLLSELLGNKAESH